MRHRLLLTALCTGLLFAGCDSASSADNPEPLHTETADTTAFPHTETSEASHTETETAESTHTVQETTDQTAPEQLSAADIDLHSADGGDQNYVFTYAGDTYSAIYTPDNWKIVNSYRITNPADIKLICEALRAVHPIHGADMQSYRTAADMAYEWAQHNLAYQLLADDSPWKAHARDVDLNPADQGKSLFELFLDRI